MDLELLYVRLPPTLASFVLILDDIANNEKHEGFGNRSWILWQLPKWTIVIAASGYLSATTVNLAE